MVDRVTSGGQSGVDQAALRAARAAGIPTGGTAPRLFLAEVEQPSLDGKTRWWRPEPCPWLATDFGLVECPEPGDDPARPGVPSGLGTVGPDGLAAQDEGQRPRLGRHLLAGRDYVVGLSGDGQGVRGVRKGVPRRAGGAGG